MPQETTIDEFRALTRRAGLDLTDEELEHLKPMYDHYLEPKVFDALTNGKSPNRASAQAPGWSERSAAWKN